MMLKATLVLSVFSISLNLQAAAADRSADYEQVRKIAARDPKVRAAYAAADRKLADRIVEIDPSLKGYTPGSAPAPKKAAPAKAAPAAPKAQAAHKTATAPASRKSATHVVQKGETLGGIAGRYGVSVATLKSANGIKDERKLAVGQKLVIPGGKSQPTVAAHPATKPAQKKSGGFWNQLGF
jgi:LysM repeat protein